MKRQSETNSETPKEKSSAHDVSSQDSVSNIDCILGVEGNSWKETPTYSVGVENAQLGY